MAIIEFLIHKSKYTIECANQDESRLIELAKKLNNRVNKIAKNFPNIDEKTLLAISALMMEDEIEARKKDDFRDEDDEIKNLKIESEEAKIKHLQDLEKILQQTESLVKKIKEC